MRLSGFLAVTCCAAVITGAFAQDVVPQLPANEPRLQHRTAEDHPSDIKVLKQMVVFNVTIHDKNGAPVRGLTAADFNLTDDNVPQTITFVEEHDATQPGQVVALPVLPPGVYSNIPNAPSNDALNVILLDNLDTGIRAQSRLFTDIQRLVAEIPSGRAHRHRQDGHATRNRLRLHHGPRPAQRLPAERRKLAQACPSPRPTSICRPTRSPRSAST